MNKILRYALPILLSFVVGVSAYYGMQHFNQTQSNSLPKWFATFAEDQLAAQLFALDGLEHNQPQQTVLMLMAMTNPMLDALIEQWSVNQDKQRIAAQCRLIRRLKIYRALHEKLLSEQTDYLKAIPDMAEAEQKRRNFLANACNQQGD